jgi:hypothetical protein
MATKTDKAAWRPTEWAESVSLCRATVYKLMNAGKIKSVKNNIGKHGARFITTSPADYLRSLERGEL